jgi:hypothetical protein
VGLSELQQLLLVAFASEHVCFSLRLRSVDATYTLRTGSSLPPLVSCPVQGRCDVPPLCSRVVGHPCGVLCVSCVAQSNLTWDMIRTSGERRPRPQVTQMSICRA